jgi:AraC-like DNA-binding protein
MHSKERVILDQPCYSMRLLKPFVQLMREDPRVPAIVLAHLDVTDVDARIPITTAHTMLQAAVALTGDEAIGLRAGGALSLKDIGVLGYAMASAANVAEALHVGGRHMRLVNDAVDFAIVRRGGEAELHFDCRVALPRQAADFMVCAMLHTWSQAWPRFMGPETRVHFAYPAPSDVSAYARAFPAQQVQFGAPYLGFSLPEALLAEPLAQADQGLHAVLRKSAELFLANLPRVESVTERVRALLITELASGHPGIMHVARQMRMSPRTLGRRLEAEGTTFSELLDTLRHSLATRYLREHDMAIPDIALLTGFAQTNAFHRAFRRWTGTTPNEYRRTHRSRALAET